MTVPETGGRPARPTEDWPGPVTYVGVGNMGAPMARLLARSGGPVTVYARRPEVRAEFAALGARASGSMAEAVRGAKVVCVCLFDEGQLRDVVLGKGGLLDLCDAGTVVVCHTTTGLNTLHRILDHARDRQVQLVDAPVSGAASEIETGKLTVLAGGDAATLDLVEPVLGTYGTVVRAGGVGSASRAKLVNNFLFAANVQLVVSAVQLARGLGISDEGMLEVLSCCSGGSEAVRHMGAAGRTPEEFGAGSSRYLVKDVAAALATATELGADPGLLEVVVRQGPTTMTGKPPNGS
ncbi:NAD(P)-dependent oxidoreductase [Amycolatopsis ultiminotia]|uniref:NAD(P)-dependent oxidoreductase n=1 Tax=Amycolatopsis ultiminotia TaxID=543629 RepID=A0ABP6V581_9PSEU